MTIYSSRRLSARRIRARSTSVHALALLPIFYYIISAHVCTVVLISARSYRAKFRTPPFNQGTQRLPCLPNIVLSRRVLHVSAASRRKQLCRPRKMSQPAPACREPAILTLTAYNTAPACVLYRSHAAYSTSISQKRTWRARLRAAIVLHSINRKMDDQNLVLIIKCTFCIVILN